MQDAQGPSGDGAKLAASRYGVPYTLLDGREVHFLYTLASIEMIESKFGSLNSLLERFNEGLPAKDSVDFLLAGLEHEGITHNDLARNLMNFQQPAEVAFEAFKLMMPKPSPNGQAPATSQSTGGTSTTSAPLDGAVVAMNSGA